MIKKNFINASVVLLTVAVVASQATAAALNYGGVGGSPANPRPGNPRTQSIFIYQLKPGQQATDAVKVINNTNQQQVVALDAVDSALASGGNFTCKQAADPKTDVGSWITMSANSVNVGPNSNAVVPFTVSVPDQKNLSVGEHDGCITLQASSQTATKSTTSGILLSFRTGIRVVVTIPGKIIKSLDITSISENKTTDGKYAVNSVVKNSGNVSLDTTLDVKLASLFGAVFSDAHEGTTPILPRTSSSYSFNINKPFWGGFYRANVLATYNSNPADELGVDNNQDQVTKQATSKVFFVPPSPLAAVIEVLFCLVIVTVAVILARKLARAKHVQDHWKEVEVSEDDTVEKLADKHHTTWKQIAKVNKLRAPYILRKGQKLKLPTKER